MNLSRYILKYSTDDGTLYFNTKTNHSFFLTNELNRVVDSNDVIRKEFHAYLDKNKYLSEGEYNKFDDKMNAKPRVINYNCDCK